MTALEVRTVDPVDVREEWELLARRVDSIPFVRPGWVLTWQAAFGSAPLRLLAGFRDGRLVAVLPLHRRLGFVRSPTNWHTPQFGVLAEDPAVEEALVEAAVERAGWQLDLRFLDERTAALVLAVADRLRRPAHVRVIENSPYVALDGTFEDYLSGRPNRLASDLRRLRRRLGELGEVSVQVHLDDDDAAFAELVRVEGSGWKVRQGTALSTDATARGFYREVARWAAAHGWLRLTLLHAGEHTVAGDLSLWHAGVAWGLKTGYDEQHRSMAPGKMLTGEVIAGAFRAGHLKAYEILGTDGSWKAQWTSLARPRLHVQVFAPGVRGRVLQAVSVHGRPRAKATVARLRALRGGSDRPPA